MENSFTREDTRAIKGIATQMILVGHIWAFADRRPAGFEWNIPFGLFDPRWVEIVGWACHITLYVFLFLGGYGFYHRVKKGAKLQNILLNLYKNYWKVFLVMIPVALLFFSNQPTDYLADTSLCNIYSNVSISDIVMNFLGLDFSLNKEWWFITAYAGAMVSGYLLLMLLNRTKSFWGDAAMVTVIAVAFSVIGVAADVRPGLSAVKDNVIFDNLIVNTNAVPFYMGMVFAKHDGLAKMLDMLDKYSALFRAVIALLTLFCIFVIRQTKVVTYDLDVVIVPFFVVSCIQLLRFMPHLKKLLAYIGRHCSNIWLIHSFYCFYFFAGVKAVYLTHDPVIALLTLLGMSIATSIIIDQLFALLKKLPAKLRKTPVNA